MIPYSLPPAETRLTARSLLQGYLGRSERFAEELSGYLGREACVLADSARSLLFLLLCCLRGKSAIKDAHILLPGYTCYSVPAAVVKSGLRVALYDIHPQTLQPDLEDVEKKINPGTLAVVGQHLLGIRSDIAGLTRIAHSRGAFCIEDSAQLLQPDNLSLEQDIPADFTLFSFGRGKPLPLGGGGALVAANASDLKKIALDLSHFPERRGNIFFPIAVRTFSHPSIYWILEKLPLGLGHTVYDPAFPVFSMPRLYRKLGTRALPELQRLNKHRTRIRTVYSEQFFPDKACPQIGADSPLVRYPLLVEKRALSKRLLNHGVRQLYPQALCDLPQLREELVSQKSTTPGARRIAEQLLTLPTHLSVTEHAAAGIAQEVSKVFPDKTWLLQSGQNAAEDGGFRHSTASR